MRLTTALRAFAAVGVVTMAMAGCSSHASRGSTTSTGGRALPDKINILSLRDETGIAAYSGLETLHGSQLAFADINAQHFLGSTQIEMTVEDPASSAQTAASLFAAAIATRKYQAVLGPIYAPESLVVAPLAEKAKVPVVFTESNVAGVLLGAYTFRATAPFSSYYPAAASAFLRNRGVKSISIIYDSTLAAYSGLAQLLAQDLPRKYGISITHLVAVQGDTQDFSAPVQRAIKGKPDAMAVLLSGPDNSTTVSQLREAGFKGQILGTEGAGVGNLKGAGAAGVGVTWPSDFSPMSSSPEATRFVREYRAKYGNTPSNFAAEGYDAAWWLARAIKESGDATYNGIQRGLSAVARQGFTGVMGKLTFVGNDMRINPVLVEWNGSQEVLVKAPS